ncbi:MAG: hypothetical protein OES35_08440 [Chromatiales bacterium]|nr:hypothetical protein [Chromatiales bacterium]
MLGIGGLGQSALPVVVRFRLRQKCPEFLLLNRLGPGGVADDPMVICPAEFERLSESG